MSLLFVLALSASFTPGGLAAAGGQELQCTTDDGKCRSDRQALMQIGGYQELLVESNCDFGGNFGPMKFECSVPNVRPKCCGLAQALSACGDEQDRACFQSAFDQAGFNSSKMMSDPNYGKSECPALAALEESEDSDQCQASVDESKLPPKNPDLAKKITCSLGGGFDVPDVKQICCDMTQVGMKCAGEPVDKQMACHEAAMVELLPKLMAAPGFDFAKAQDPDFMANFCPGLTKAFAPSAPSMLLSLRSITFGRPVGKLAKVSALQKKSESLLDAFAKKSSLDGPDCATCVQGFQNEGGCQAWTEKKWKQVREAIPNGCGGDRCMHAAAEACNIKKEESESLLDAFAKKSSLDGPDCATCVQGFQNEGGCQAWTEKNWEQVREAIPDGCGGDRCMRAAAEACKK